MKTIAALPLILAFSSLVNAALPSEVLTYLESNYQFKPEILVSSFVKVSFDAYGSRSSMYVERRFETGQCIAHTSESFGWGPNRNSYPIDAESCQHIESKNNDKLETPKSVVVATGRGDFTVAVGKFPIGNQVVCGAQITRVKREAFSGSRIQTIYSMESKKCHTRGSFF